MRKAGGFLIIISIAAVGAMLTGCPGEDSNLTGSWVMEDSETTSGVTFTEKTIYKFTGDGGVTFAVGYAISGSGWSVEMRAWMRGKYSTAAETVFITFSGAQCQDIAAKLVVNGIVPNEIGFDLDGLLAGLEDTIYGTPLDALLPMPYEVNGDTLTLIGLLPFDRFNDSFNYSDPTSTSCE